MRKITPEEYLEALEIVHAYTAQQLKTFYLGDIKEMRETRRVVNVLQIAKELVKEFNLNKITRKSEYTIKRQYLSWWLRKNTNLSYEEIGSKFFGQDHATVIHSCRIIEEYIETKNAKFHQQIVELEIALKPYEK